jgi:predicted GNAT family acetyltransferase
LSLDFGPSACVEDLGVGCLGFAIDVEMEHESCEASAHERRQILVAHHAEDVFKFEGEARVVEEEHERLYTQPCQYTSAYVSIRQHASAYEEEHERLYTQTCEHT